MITLANIFKKSLMLLLLACVCMQVSASNRGPVVWDEELKQVYTDNNEAFVGVDFYIDIYDIAHMRANEAEYEGYLKKLISDNNANVVRIAPWVGYWEDITPDSYWYQAHLDDLTYAIDKAVQWADEANAYALISYGPTADYTRTNAFFDAIGAVYKDDAHVMFQVTSDPTVSFLRLKLDEVNAHLASIAPNTHRIFEPTKLWERRRGAQEFTQYGNISFPVRVETAPAVEDFIIDSQPKVDYVIKTTLPATTSNRWESVSGMSFAETVDASAFTQISFEIKAKYAQSYWVYLRDASNNDLGAYYNTYTGDEWNTVTLTSSDFGSIAAGSIASVQFFIGNDANYDSNSGNDFYFDNVVVSDAQRDYNVARGSVDEQGTGWTSVGYNQTSVSITREEADTPVIAGYAMKLELSVDNPQNRWDSVAGMVLENSFSISDFDNLSFDVRADVGQSFWVYLRDADGQDIGAHYNTYAPQEWTTVTLRPSDFTNASVNDVVSVQFFIGYDANYDSSSTNAFYFDNLVVNSTNGPQQGARGKTDANGTGWYDVGYGIIRSVVDRIEEGEVTPPPSEVAYNIAYARTGGTDYYVSPEGDDSNDGLSQATAVKTPQVGADKLGPGDRLIVMPGDYDTPGYGTMIDLSTSGTADNWISIEAYETGTANFKVRGQYGVVFRGASYVQVKGLNISGLADTLTPEEAEAKRLLNWYSEGLVGVGIGTEPLKIGEDYTYPHHVIIEDNHVYNMSAGGIAMKRADYMLIKNNLVHNNAYYNVWAPSGISVWESFNHDDNTETYRTVITGNTSYGNYNYFKFFASSNPDIANQFTDGNGIIIDALAIDQGYTSDGLDGIYSGRTLIENNITYNNGGKGINLYASDNIDVIHNVSYNNGTHPEIDGEIALGNVKNVRMYNNIIQVAAGEAAFIEYQSQNLDISHNIIVKDGAFVEKDNLNLTTNSIYEVPQFVDKLNFDFNVMPSSPAIDAGTDKLKSFVDITGGARPQGGAVDIGAYEY
ncbi:right-handed parallel beta-helix repeat-containing protein [Glaciecola siphonariae]|uniref:Right-handed parallel beta-helix repeat-containing protein n=1 Tax=Glaciecola siphonariae TaxID=521012 RepID=A0ABV9LSB4_9ALTE